MFACGLDARFFGAAKLAAIGPGTAARLLDYHLQTDILPDEYRAEALAAALATEARGKSFLLIRASRGREVLAEVLRAAGGEVEQTVVYDSVDVATPEARVAQLLGEGQIDWMTVTSSAIARSLVKLFGEQLKQTKLASISPITSATLRELGYEPAAEAREYTMAGVVEAILR
jgi:uroporphyrinogen III methyltransferase/synthase